MDGQTDIETAEFSGFYGKTWSEPSVDQCTLLRSLLTQIASGDSGRSSVNICVAVTMLAN